MMGVYMILNTKNQKKYIGSSKDVDKRFSEHKKMLEQNKHHSFKLQLAWNRVKDKNVFEFFLIEEVTDINELKQREQLYIDFYDAFNKGYNCSALVDNPKYARKNISKREREKQKQIKLQECENSISILEQYKEQYNINFRWSYKHIIRTVKHVIGFVKLIELTNQQYNFSIYTNITVDYILSKSCAGYNGYVIYISKDEKETDFKQLKLKYSKGKYSLVDITNFKKEKY